MLKNKILYFPYINLDEESCWYKHAILYWDGIDTITHNFIVDPYDGDTQLLYEKKLLNQFHIREHISEQNILLYREHLSTLPRSKKTVSCYPGKFDESLLEYLFFINRAKPGRSRFSNIEIEENAALLYLSLRYSDSRELENYNLVTDSSRMLKILNYGKTVTYSRTIERQTNYSSLLLKNILPVPRENVSLIDVLNFKEKYKPEYRNLRAHLENKFKYFSNLDNYDDAEIEIVIREIKEAAYDYYLTPLQHVFNAVSLLTMPIIDYKLSDNLPIFQTLNAVRMLRPVRENKLQYIGLIKNKLR